MPTPDVAGDLKDLVDELWSGMEAGHLGTPRGLRGELPSEPRSPASGGSPASAASAVGTNGHSVAVKQSQGTDYFPRLTYRCEVMPMFE